MMKTVVFRCRPNSRFHFGQFAADESTALNDTTQWMHSDSLFAAIVVTYDRLFGDPFPFMASWKEHVEISSLFHMLQKDNKQIWFLPKPISFNLFEKKYYKEMSRLKFISKGVWDMLDVPTNLMTSSAVTFLQDGEYAVLKDEIDINNEYELRNFKVVNEHTSTRVKVHSDTQDDSLYQITHVEIPNRSYTKLFGKNDNMSFWQTHFYFLLKNENMPEAFQEQLDVVLQALETEGIGGDRSNCGQLDSVLIESDSIHFKNETQEFFCNLSLLSPKPDELDRLLFYQTILRGGRTIGTSEYATNQLKAVQMIREGAIVKNLSGNVVSIDPPRKQETQQKENYYVRFGKSFCIPIKKSWIKNEITE